MAGPGGCPGRLSWGRGARFEARMRRRFQDHGFRATKVREADGYDLGRDIALSVNIALFGRDSWAVLPVAIQCKATKRGSDLPRGLDQARRSRLNGFRKAAAFVCLHSQQPTALGRRPALRIAYSTSPQIGAPYERLTWPILIARLTDLIPVKPQQRQAVLELTKTQL